ncbi:unnamed protein product [Camellia sinensis]
MGNHRFRLSDMIPNAWFYKLKDMGSRTRNRNINHPRKKKQPITSLSTTSSSSSSSITTTTTSNPLQHQSKPIQPHLLPSHQRKSYYYSRDLTPSPQSPLHPPKSPPETIFPELPRKSSKQSRSTRNRASIVKPALKLVTSSVSSVSTKPDSTSEEYPNSPLDSSSDPESLFPEFGSDHSSVRCRFEDDIVFDIIDSKFDVFDSVSKLQLPPIVTKKTINDSIQEIEKKKIINSNELTKQRTSPVRRLSASSPGLKLRTNSPRIANKKIQAHARKSVSSSTSSGGGGGRRSSSLSESFAVVKSSADPQRDFKESMVEMILQNNIRASKDLEDLLTCYLQLNSDEYHELIIKVFKQIWFDLANVKG